MPLSPQLRNCLCLIIAIAVLSFSTPTTATASDTELLAANIHANTNSVRQAKALPSLEPSSRLTRAAQEFARRLARSSEFSHTADGKTLGRRAKENGYRFRNLGENIAWSSFRVTESEMAQRLVTDWMASRGHRKNILDAKFQHIGVGVSTYRGRVFAVQIFGRPMN